MQSGPGWYAAPRSRRSRRIALVVALVPVLLIATFLGSVWYGLNGGWPGIRAGLVASPRPQDPAVAAAMRSAQARLSTDLAEVTEGFGPGLHSDDDDCIEGKNNWKVQDGYVWSCHIRADQLVSFDGDFRRAALALSDRLRTAGWSSNRGLVGNLDEYGDRSTVDQLPSVQYERDGTRFNLGFAEKASARPISSLGSWSEGAKAADLILQEHDYVMIVGISRRYYSN